MMLKAMELVSSAIIRPEPSVRIVHVLVRAAEAIAYNGLVQSWPEITSLASESGKPKSEQGGLSGETEE